MQEKVRFYCEKIEVLSLSGLLFFLPFTGSATVKDTFFFLLAVSVITDAILQRNSFWDRIHKLRMLYTVMIVSFLWGFMSLLNAVDPSYSLNQVTTKMSKQYLLFFFAYFSLKTLPLETIKRIFIPFICSVLFMSLYACYQFYVFPVPFENRVTGLTGAFYRLATFLVIAAPVLLVFTALSRGWVKRVLLFGMLSLFAALFFTFTRAAWIAVIAEMCILIVIFLKRYRRALLAFILISALTFIMLSYKSIIPTQFILHGSEQPRLVALERSIEVIKKYPLTGIGYGKKTFSIYHPEVGEVLHAHNIFLNTAIETGIPGLLIFVLLLFIVLKDFIKGLRHAEHPQKKIILTGIFASCIGFLIINQFDFMYHGWPGQLFWMFAGIGYAIMNTSQRINT
jgi:putative inorganic carbon (HCO3(-)) transporter